MEPSTIDVLELIPHGPEAVIIDRLVSYEPERSTAVVEIGPGSAFVEKGVVPGWVGIEYMAQAIAAHAGYEARKRGEHPRIGFLLGTRAYNCRIPGFPVGSTLRIVVEPLYVEAGFGSFSCSIEMDGVVADAIVNTYQPSERGAAPTSAREAQT